MTLRRGTKVLLDGADFVVHPGERVGIVGKNGAGKSSLFALLTGALDPDAGNLDLPAGWRIASVQQEIAADAQAAREFVIDGDTHLRALQAQRAALTDDQGTQIAETEAALIEAGAWSAARAPSSCSRAWDSSHPNGCSRCAAFPAAGACGWCWRAR